MMDGDHLLVIFLYVVWRPEIRNVWKLMGFVQLADFAITEYGLRLF